MPQALNVSSMMKKNIHCAVGTGLRLGEYLKYLEYLEYLKYLEYFEIKELYAAGLRNYFFTGPSGITIFPNTSFRTCAAPA